MMIKQIVIIIILFLLTSVIYGKNDGIIDLIEGGIKTAKEVIDYDDAEMFSKVFEYLKDPDGLSIEFGLANMSFRNMIGTNLEPGESSIHDALLYRAQQLTVFSIGISIGNAYTIVRFSPSMGGITNEGATNDCFYVEAESGAWLINKSDLVNGPISGTIRVGLHFYGSMMGFQNQLEFLSEEDHKQFYNGLGFVMVGMGASAIAGPVFKFRNFGIKRIEILFGMYIRINSLLPVYPRISIGFTGPDINVYIVDWLGFYCNMQLWKNHASFDMARIGGGVLLKF